MILNDNQNRRLLRSIADAVSPDPLHDHDIDRLRSDDVSVLPPEQLQRILAGTHALMADQPNFNAGRNQLTTDNAVDASEFHERIIMKRQVSHSPRGRSPRGAALALVVSALGLAAVLIWTSQQTDRDEERIAEAKAQQSQHLASIQDQWSTAESLPAVDSGRVVARDVIQTGVRERRRAILPDGSVLYVNERTRVRVDSDRRIIVDRGEVYVEVVPHFEEGRRLDKFEVVTPARTVTALGTRFGVKAENGNTNVLVTQGKVDVSGMQNVLPAGQILTSTKTAAGSDDTVRPSIRASEKLSWTRDLINAATAAIVPRSKHAGGSIVTVDPNGQEMKLSLRKLHVDVHIQDGFARTTIDQTYFNHTSRRLEGTFHFPLPADASLSRLAMYVNGKLMEGGMAERQHARNTFEKIVHRMQDPALLEWVDGSTFRMRVFPLEARQEKRIVLSYTQRLTSAYGKTTYRFPAGHSMDAVRDWSTRINVTDGQQAEWNSPSHKLTAQTEGSALILTGSESDCLMDRDLVLELKDDSSTNDNDSSGRTAWKKAYHERDQYILLSHRPHLPGRAQKPDRHWVVLFEASADRNPILARTQVEIIRTLLENAEHTDTFNIVTANTQATLLSEKPLKCTRRNIANAIDYLEQTHLIGGLDLESALRQCAAVSESELNTVLVHIGSAIPVLGQRDQSDLLQLLPEEAAYIGVGVGKSWSQPFMRAAAGRTGGYFTQINPDEEVAWRSFELSSLLNTPRLLDVRVTAAGQSNTNDGVRAVDGVFLNFADTVAQGEEICAVMRIGRNVSLPKSVVVTGRLNGKLWKKKIPVSDITAGANYLPRSWAKLQIDRLVSESAAEHRSEIIRLSKSMYVMSPFTSLLVLENEEMYTTHNIDRGRKDHWALYDCPQQIAVVREPLTAPQRATVLDDDAKTESWRDTVRWLSVPQWYTPPVRYVRTQNGMLVPDVDSTWLSIAVPTEPQDLSLRLATDQLSLARGGQRQLDRLGELDAAVTRFSTTLSQLGHRRGVSREEALVRTRELSSSEAARIVADLDFPVKVEQLNELGLLVLKGNTTDVQLVEQLIEQLEMGEAGGSNAIEIVNLQQVGQPQVQRQLQELLGATDLASSTLTLPDGPAAAPVSVDRLSILPNLRPHPSQELPVIRACSRTMRGQHMRSPTTQRSTRVPVGIRCLFYPHDSHQWPRRQW